MHSRVDYNAPLIYQEDRGNDEFGVTGTGEPCQFVCLFFFFSLHRNLLLGLIKTHGLQVEMHGGALVSIHQTLGLAISSAAK